MSNSSQKLPYRTTESAGYFVAGLRIPSGRDEDGNRVPKVGHVLYLTEAEAKYELLQGSIEPGDGSAQPVPLSPPARHVKPASKQVEASAEAKAD